MPANTKGVLRRQTSKREMLRKSLAVANKLDQVVKVSLILGAELFALDPKNTVFRDGTLTDESIRQIKRIARLKGAQSAGKLGPGIGQDDPRIAKVSRVPWWKQFVRAFGQAFREM